MTVRELQEKLNHIDGSLEVYVMDRIMGLKPEKLKDIKVRITKKSEMLVLVGDYFDYA